LKKYIIFILILLTNLSETKVHACSSDEHHIEEPRLINRELIYKSLGMKNGKFDKNHKAVFFINGEPKKGIEKLEGNKSKIDTENEFLTMLFNNRNETLTMSPKAADVINKEIPTGKTGFLRISSMWLLGFAEKPTSKANNYKVLTFLSKYSGASIKEMEQYYAKAVKIKIRETNISSYKGVFLTNKEKQKVKQLLYNYMVKPSNMNSNKYKNYKQYLLSINIKKSNLLTKWIEKISPLINIHLGKE